MVSPPPYVADGIIDFPGMDPEERFRFYFRKHWIHPAKKFVELLFWMIVFIVVTFLSGVLDTQDPFLRHVTLMILGGFLVIPHFIFIAKIYEHFLCISIVTDKKIHYFKRTLVMTDRHETVNLWVLQDIKKIQNGLFQNMFGFGSLLIEAQNSQMRIHFVPKIDDVYEAIAHEIALRRATPQEIKHMRDSIANDR